MCPSPQAPEITRIRRLIQKVKTANLDESSKNVFSRDGDLGVGRVSTINGPHKEGPPGENPGVPRLLNRGW